jgi:hypothetical protein
MMTNTVLVRIRFPGPVADHLAQLAREIGATLKRKVTRASLLRTLVHLHADAIVTSPELASTLDADTVRRGRARGAQRRTS